MSKSVLVIDTPDDCMECKLKYDSFGIDYRCILNHRVVEEYIDKNTKPIWCPLKPLPERKDLTH